MCDTEEIIKLETKVTDLERQIVDQAYYDFMLHEELDLLGVPRTITTRHIDESITERPLSSLERIEWLVNNQ